MTAIVGYAGSFKVGANVVAETGDWQLNIDAAILDVTKFSDAWKDTLSGLRSWNGKASGRWDMTDTNGQLAMQNALLNGTTLTVSFYVSATHFYTGTVWVKSLGIKDSVSSAVDYDCNFDGNGALSYT